MKFMRFWWGFGVVLVLAALVVCLVPFHDIPGEFKLSDKLGHLLGHGALAAYFAGLVPRPRWWKVFAFLLLFGVGIESAQYAMQVGRDGDPRDVIANGAGAALGLLAARLGLERWPEFAERLLGQRRPAQ
jgi:glycopeptide antibiotics resistance protein